MNKVPLIKPTLMGKKTIFKTDTIPTKGSNNIVTSDALAQALQDKVVNKEEEGEKTIVPTGDIIIGKLLEDGFYIEDPTFLGTRLIKIETPTPGKFYYDKTTHTYYTFQGYSETGYKFKPVVLSNLTELTWQELKDLRNDSRLIPGSLYRITDYQCTTTQQNTRSAGHQFDIVLLALSENKLAEEGWAMHHANDTYFANSNLSAWKVWYCLDNDKSKFSWADDSVDEDVNTSFITISNDSGIIYYYKNFVGNKHLWESSEGAAVFTNSETPENGDTVYDYQKRTGYKTIGRVASYTAAHEGTGLPNGRGVIYRLIDEWNNNIPYDFKNILIYNEVYSQYCYAIIDNTNTNNVTEDPTLDGTKVKAIHVLCDNNDVLKPVAKGRFRNNPLVNIIFLNNSILADEYSNCVVSNGLPIVS